MNKTDYRALVTDDLEKKSAPVSRQDFRVFISEEAFDQIGQKADPSREVGGILVGSLAIDERGPYIHVEAVIDALHAEEREAELTFTHATWDHINRAMDTEHIGKRMVGWYHTHPGFGIFLSERDQFIQQSFFSEPFQIALVYDPASREHGIFSWRNGAPWRLRRYWIGGSEHEWDGERERLEKKPAPKVTPAPVVPPPPPPATTGEVGWDLTTVLSVLVAAVLGGAFGIWWEQHGSDLRERERGVREAIGSFNEQILDVLRGSLSDESLGKNLDKWEQELAIRIDPLRIDAASNPALQPAVNALEESRKILVQAKTERRLAHAVMEKLVESTHKEQNPPGLVDKVRYHDEVLRQMMGSQYQP